VVTTPAFFERLAGQMRGLPVVLSAAPTNGMGRALMGLVAAGLVTHLSMILEQREPDPFDEIRGLLLE